MLPFGISTVTITDANGCESMCSVDIMREVCIPCIELTKSSSLDLGANGIANPGDIVTYTYDVLNCGDLTLTNVLVTESSMAFTGTGILPVPGPLVPSTLAVNEMGTITSTYAITQEDIDAGIITNQALVVGIDPFNENIEDDSDSGNPLDELGTEEDPTNESIPQDPCIGLIKSSSIDLGADGLATPGDIITYTYDVTNCGNVTLSNVSVEELNATFTGTGTLPVPSPLVPSILNAGESGISTATYAITQEDINAGGVANQASASGEDPMGEEVEDDSDSGNPGDEMGTEEDPTNVTLDDNPCIEIIKSSSLNLGLDGSGNSW